MQRKFLEDLKLDKETIDKILDENSADIGKAKKDYDDVKSKLDDAEKQLNTANGTIKDLKKNNADNETLQKTIKTHEETIKQLKNEHEAEMKGMKIDSAISKLLADNKAQHPELLAGKFDRTKLQLSEDGEIIGLNDQFKTIKESYKDMFGVAVAGKTPPNPEGGLKGTTFESLVNDADTMTAEEVAAQFAAMEKE